MKEDDLILEISTTLEQIQKVNQYLAYHRAFEQPDQNAIDNFLALREDFLQQLSALMLKLQLEVRLVA